MDQITVTEVSKPRIVYSEQGRVFEMKCRKSFGLSFCIDGKNTFTMNGKKFVSDLNHVILLPKDGSYTLCCDEKGVFPVINFQCEGLNLNEIQVLSSKNPKACLNLCEKIQNDFLFGRSKLRILSDFYDLLDHLLTVENDQNPLIPVVSFIEENLSDQNITNALMAAQVGFSEIYFRKLFIKQYHMTPKQYVIELRLRKAKLLLTDATLTVTEIADACGFSSVYHFSRAFKAREGITPSEYAKKNKVFGI